jgi:hypothetical protein
MKLPQVIDLLHLSSERLVDMLDIPEEVRDVLWWRVLRREAWLHFRRTIDLLWLVLRRKV